MTSKERVRAALGRRSPDRLPVDYWATSEVTARLVRELAVADEEALLRKLGADLRYLEPAYAGPKPERAADGSWRDIWGVWRKKVAYGGGSYDEVTVYPLAGMESAEQLETHPWPKAEWFDFRPMRRSAERLGDYYLVNAADRLNRTSALKAAIYLRGMDRIMMDLALNPEFAKALFARIAKFYLDCNAAMFAETRGVLDMFFMGDDFGTQSGLLVSREMWLEFFAPHLAAFSKQAHDAGLKTMLHSCGAVSEIMDDLADCGVDVVNPLQPGAAGMVPAELKARFGARLAFHGAIDVQRTLPEGTPEEVRAEVRARFRDLGASGGYIAAPSHNFQPDVPTANILALFDEAGKCRY
ncbi:MAG TPA: uroporphyrinogen decarboxylase family protein [Planctomycetota bacterium]|nr:uroporphyrinogen decarboxylase family protein [Planctomycetota bacterium]